MDISAILERIWSAVTEDPLRQWIKAGLIALFGLAAVILVRRRLRPRYMSVQQQLVLRRLLVVVIMSVTVMWCMRELGLDVGVLLGAAGLLTVAVGFASQTAASNLISGLFLMVERPFKIGSVVRVSDVQGEVLSIDFMSVSLRTFDNLLVRIPNETMLKSNVVNVTRFPNRRFDLKVGVAYKENLEAVKQLLLDVPKQVPLALVDPPPRLFMLGFGDSSVDLQLSVWAKQDDFFDMANSLYIEVKKALEQAGMEIPFPHVSVYAGEATKPIPVQLASPH